MDKTEKITYLTTNCSCWKKAGDAAVLNLLPEEKLEEMVAATQQAHESQAVINSIKQGFGIPETATIDELPQLITNAVAALGEEEEEEEVPPFKKKKKAVVANSDPEDDEEEDDELERKVTNMTAEEWLASAPPVIASAVTNALKIEKQAKEQLVERLVANQKDAGKKTLLANKLMKQSLPELEELAELLPLAPTTNAQTPGSIISSLFNYSGAAGGPTTNRQALSQDDLLPPTSFSLIEEKVN